MHDCAMAPWQSVVPHGNAPNMSMIPPRSPRQCHMAISWACQRMCIVGRSVLSHLRPPDFRSSRTVVSCTGTADTSRTHVTLPVALGSLFLETQCYGCGYESKRAAIWTSCYDNPGINPRGVAYSTRIRYFWCLRVIRQYGLSSSASCLGCR